MDAEAIVATGGSVISPGPNYDPTSSFNNTNTFGYAVLWITFGLMIFSSITFFISFIRARTEKIREFSTIYIIITVISATSYLCIALDQGYVRKEDGRRFHFARYIDWAITTPLLLFELANLAGAGGTLTRLMLALNEIMIVCGLFGGLSVRVAPRWTWFAMGCLAGVPVFYFFLLHFRRYLNIHTHRAYTFQSTRLAVLWLIYPIAWGLTDGSHIISTDGEHLWFAILDVSSKCMHGMVLLFYFRNALPFSGGFIADTIPGAPRHPDIFHNDREISSLALPLPAGNYKPKIVNINMNSVNKV